jgi:hypothetical protein
MPQHNEFDFVKKIYIGMIILSLFSIMFATMTGTSLGLDCTQDSINPQCQLNNIQASIVSASTSLSHSFDNWTKSPLTQISSSFLGSGVVNFFLIYPTDFLAHAGGALWNVVQLLGNSIYVVIFIITSLIPALFSSTNFGVFATIFSVIYSFTIVITVFYALYLIIQRAGLVMNVISFVKP